MNYLLIAGIVLWAIGVTISVFSLNNKFNRLKQWAKEYNDRFILLGMQPICVGKNGVQHKKANETAAPKYAPGGPQDRL